MYIALGACVLQETAASILARSPKGTQFVMLTLGNKVTDITYTAQ